MRDGVLTRTLNRPGKLNAINNDLALRLLDALRSAAADPGVRVVRLRGKGRAFCARLLLFLCEAFDAQPALEWGLVYRVVNGPDREEASWHVATALAALEPVVARAFRRVMNQIGLPAFDRDIEAENGAQRLLGSEPGPT